MTVASKEEIFSAQINFEKTALDVFNLQAQHNSVYAGFIKHLGINPGSITGISQIPFLPVQFFKTKNITTAIAGSTIRQPTGTVFTSSGTTGMLTSHHHVTDISWYKTSYTRCFQHFYGPVNDYCILALLPSYLDRGGSSLVYMVNDLINLSNHALSGFYLYDFGKLTKTINHLIAQKQKFILLGVTFALLDYAESNPTFSKEEFARYATVMETGGMKGRRKEMIREEVHTFLSNRLGVAAVHSEYGMTELLSQAYSTGNGVFSTPSWMRILIRDVNDPFKMLDDNNAGGVNIIDLANINSCSFIATQDLGKKLGTETFEITGRFDNSDLRGCNLMVI